VRDVRKVRGESGLGEWIEKKRVRRMSEVRVLKK
jgi:hypothetical protein